MEDVRFLKEMSWIYHAMECLKNVEVAYSVGDYSTCELWCDMYPHFSDSEGAKFADVYARSTRAKNAKELYYWCVEDVKENVLQVVRDEQVYWVGIFEKICQEFLARLNYDTTLITEQMQNAFFDAFWALMRMLKTAPALKLVTKVSKDVFVLGTEKMQKLWANRLDEVSKGESSAIFVSSMVSLMQEQNCSDEEIIKFFSLLGIGIDIAYN